MKCGNCGIETDICVAVSVSWHVVKDGMTVYIDGLSPKSVKRMLCADCFAKMAEPLRLEAGK